MKLYWDVILHTFEIWEMQMKERLFKSYIDTFLKMKQESSGFPHDCLTDEEKQQHISEYNKHEETKLRQTKTPKAKTATYRNHDRQRQIHTKTATYENRERQKSRQAETARGNIDAQKQWRTKSTAGKVPRQTRTATHKSSDSWKQLLLMEHFLLVHKNFFYLLQCQESPSESNRLRSEIPILSLFNFSGFRGFSTRHTHPLVFLPLSLATLVSISPYYYSPYITMFYQMHYVRLGFQRQDIVTFPC